MVVNDSKNVPKCSKYFHCDICDYSTSRKSQYDRHINTPKHAKHVNDSKMVVNKFEKVPKKFICACGKEYKYDSGYYRHKKTCTFKKKESSVNELTLEVLVAENIEIKKMMVEICKKIEPISNNDMYINNVNSHNKVFNISLFLNEDCKDAMNVS